MKTIGILGGMSWESSAQYYALINREVRARKGGIVSAPLVMHSFDFDHIAALQRAGEWEQLGDILGQAAAGLEKAGADCILIATNTMHLVAPQVETRISCPLLHIADPLAEAFKAAGHDTVGLLATRFTMEQPFYAERLAQHGLKVVVPDESHRAEIHRVIFDELCAGEVRAKSREFYCDVIDDLQSRGAQGVALACTEIMLLIEQCHSPLPLFDTTALHCKAAVDFSMS
ncbi:aspartate/glutamate racemase family protein [Qipengyuania sp. S6317L1]|uniref:aspartate/glutamate racemase family protein n=1 Tax=Qipengyuania sp. S6317L1 TaxID=2926410 RepID=UPI001FF5AF4D|nr:aspartate/glutamate racemase family protein [Qipengyuania sp. S6317L1]MCK0099819.1 aspartate/glutamate racemase family protein [Qipengyuania sp. S6317L1]